MNYCAAELSLIGHPCASCIGWSSCRFLAMGLGPSVRIGRWLREDHLHHSSHVNTHCTQTQSVRPSQTQSVLPKQSSAAHMFNAEHWSTEVSFSSYRISVETFQTERSQPHYVRASCENCNPAALLRQQYTAITGVHHLPSQQMRTHKRA